MSSKKIIFLFSPKFKDFGIDIAKRFIQNNPGWQVGGLCTGGPRIIELVKKSLGSDVIFGLWDLEKTENQWLEANKIDKELLTQIDITLGIGASGEIITSDRRIGVGYVRGGECRPDKFGELSRQDSVEIPLKYLQGLYSFLIKLFDEHQPELVFCYAVAGAPATALGLICKAKDIKFNRFSPTRISNQYIIDDDYKGRMKPIEKIFVVGVSDQRLREKAEKFLSDYRMKPTQPVYYVHSSSKSRENNIIEFTVNYLKFCLRFIIGKLIPSLKKNTSFIGLKRKAFELKLEWRKLQILRKNIFSEISNNTNYIYFPLHVNPEASTMVLSPMHTDQISVIEALSKSLSGDQVLVVKEHLPMLGKRPKEFYEIIQKIPRVILLSPFQDSLKLINDSDAVAVISGTAAFEALLLRKKAIVIGDSPYLAIGKGIVHETSLANLPHAMASLREVELADDETLIRYIASAFSCSFTMLTSTFWGKYKRAEDDHEVDVLIDDIVSKMNS